MSNKDVCNENVEDLVDLRFRLLHQKIAVACANARREIDEDYSELRALTAETITSFNATLASDYAGSDNTVSDNTVSDNTGSDDTVSDDTAETHELIDNLRELIVNVLQTEERVELDDRLVAELHRLQIVNVVQTPKDVKLDDDQLAAELQQLQIANVILTRERTTEIEPSYYYGHDESDSDSDGENDVESDAESDHESDYGSDCDAVPVFKQKFRVKLPYYDPSEASRLAQIKGFTDADFCASLKPAKLRPGNMNECYKKLLEIEDLTNMVAYPPLAQRGVTVRWISGITYSVNIPKSTEDAAHDPLNEVLKPFMDQAILVPLASTVATPAPKTPVDILMEHPHEKVSNLKLRRIVATVVKVYSDHVNFELDRTTIKLDVTKSYDIIFRPLRIPFRFQYRALEMLAAQPQLQRYLFPSRNPPKQEPGPSFHLQMFNKDVGRNPEQLQAVRNIVEGPNSHAPYIIFGPPGTGKTTTIVEAILQLRLMKPLSRILVTASSNSACDTIALRICKYFKGNSAAAQRLYHRQCQNGAAAGYLPLMRVFSQSILRKGISQYDKDLLAFSNVCDGICRYPRADELRRFGITVVTLCTAGRLINAGINEKAPHFTHIFIDEAGAATETEALVGIVGIKKADDDCRVILSGDHKQLGPVVKSPRAAALGLGRSLMERLISRKCYALDERGNYDKSLQTRLRRNYRSHEEIVRLYNHLYYDNQLLAVAAKEDVDRYGNFMHLRNPKFPIIFNAVHGQAERDTCSMSSYNNLEIDVVMWYVHRFLVDGIAGQPRIQQSDIGIISPYKCQYLRIRELLKERWPDVETGSAETFQGREKSIIIVSFVRSFNGLGFIGNPRRLNVILSRAKSLLIICGNPTTLRRNDDFHFIINECKRHGTLKRKPRTRKSKVDHSEIMSLSLNSSAWSSMASLSSEKDEEIRLARKFSEFESITNPLAGEDLEIIDPIELRKPDSSKYPQNLTGASEITPSTLPLVREDNMTDNLEILQSIDAKKAEATSKEMLTAIVNEKEISELSLKSSTLSLVVVENAEETMEIMNPVELQNAEEFSNEILTASLIEEQYFECSLNLSGSTASLSEVEYTTKELLATTVLIENEFAELLLKSSTTPLVGVEIAAEAISMEIINSVDLQSAAEISEEILTTSVIEKESFDFVIEKETFDSVIEREFFDSVIETESFESSLNLSANLALILLPSAEVDNATANIEIIQSPTSNFRFSKKRVIPTIVISEPLIKSTSPLADEESTVEATHIFKPIALEKGETRSYESSQNSSPTNSVSFSASLISLSSIFDESLAGNRNENIEVVAGSTTDEDSGVIDDDNDGAETDELSSNATMPSKTQSLQCLATLPLEVVSVPSPRRCYSTTQLYNMCCDFAPDFPNESTIAENHSERSNSLSTMSFQTCSDGAANDSSSYIEDSLETAATSPTDENERECSEWINLEDEPLIDLEQQTEANLHIEVVQDECTKNY